MNGKECPERIEPTRKSILDVLKENLKAANRKNYVHRLIYIGEHTFGNEPGSTIGEMMEKTIQKVNETFHDECLTGLFVVYPKYFCHMLEGSEDSIMKHLHILVGNEENLTLLVKVKVLICYHHINQRFLPYWISIMGKPPTLFEQMPVDADCPTSFSYMYTCIQKLYKLAYIQRRKSKIVGSKKTYVYFTEEKYPECLPEYGLLEFLLASEYAMDLQRYMEFYFQIPRIITYKDKVWPIPSEFVPFNIFHTPSDPVIDLPATEEDSIDND